MTEQQMHKHIPYLDVAKGIGILLVMISHSCRFPSYFIERVFIACFMPLFFVISGYVYKSGRKVRENIQKRVQRCLIPYFGYSFLLILLHCIFDVFADKFQWSSLKNWIIGCLYSRYCFYPLGTEPNYYFLTADNSPLWFLTSILSASIIFYFLIEKCLKSRVFTCFSIVGLLVITAILSKLPILLPWSLDTAPIGAAFMIVGTMLKHSAFLEKQYKSIWKASISITLLSIYLIAVEWNQGINMSVRMYGYQGTISVAVFFFIGIVGTTLYLLISKTLMRLHRTSALLERVGKETVLLMSVHMLTFRILDGIVINILKLDLSNQVLYWSYGYLKVFLVACMWSYGKEWVKRKSCKKK